MLASGLSPPKSEPRKRHTTPLMSALRAGRSSQWCWPLAALSWPGGGGARPVRILSAGSSINPKTVSLILLLFGEIIIKNRKEKRKKGGYGRQGRLPPKVFQ